MTPTRNMRREIADLIGASIADNGPHGPKVETGGSVDGVFADIWFTVDGFDFYMTLRPSNRQLEKMGLSLPGGAE